MGNDFKVSTECHVRFADTDAMGHVNNAKFFSYMEQGRVAYIQKISPGVDMQEGLKAFPFILANIQCSFKSPLFCDETVLVSLGTTQIGTKSFTLEYLLTEKDSGRLVATGTSVQVMFDYQKNATYPMPPEVRQQIEALEGRTLP